jgi:hypothetical protein
MTPSASSTSIRPTTAPVGRSRPPLGGGIGSLLGGPGGMGMLGGRPRTSGGKSKLILGGGGMGSAVTTPLSTRPLNDDDDDDDDDDGMLFIILIMRPQIAHFDDVHR